MENGVLVEGVVVDAAPLQNLMKRGYEGGEAQGEREWRTMSLCSANEIVV